MLRCPVRFDANVDPTSEAAQAVDEDEERRLDNKNKPCFEEMVAGRDKDEQIIKRGDGDNTERHAAR